MLTLPRSLLPLSRLSRPPLPSRLLSTTASPHKNPIYPPIRTPSALTTLLHLTTTQHIPLLTYWSASYCPSCRTISPLLHSILTSSTAPCPRDPAKKIAFVEVQFDAPEIMGSALGMDFVIASLPCVLVFEGGEVVGREADGRRLADEGWVREWVEGLVRGGEGGGRGKGVFEGLWGRV